MKLVGDWVLTVLYFMVVLPICHVVQGLFTPFELIWNAIVFKKAGQTFEPSDYFEIYGQNAVKAFSAWFDEDEEEA